MNFKMEDIAKILLPMLVSAIIWLLNSVGSFNEHLVKIEGQMPALITPQGVPTDRSELNLWKKEVSDDSYCWCIVRYFSGKWFNSFI
jgi:hypothetical protein